MKGKTEVGGVKREPWVCAKIQREVETVGGRAKEGRREHMPSLWGGLRDVSLANF